MKNAPARTQRWAGIFFRRKRTNGTKPPEGEVLLSHPAAEHEGLRRRLRLRIRIRIRQQQAMPQKYITATHDNIARINAVWPFDSRKENAPGELEVQGRKKKKIDPRLCRGFCARVDGFLWGGGGEPLHGANSNGITVSENNVRQCDENKEHAMTHSSIADLGTLCSPVGGPVSSSRFQD